MSENPKPSILPPQEAREILRQAITERLGPDWESPDSRWVVVTNHDYMARLNRGRVNVDFYVDYFDGSVQVESSEVHSGQEVGRMFAWIMVILFAVMMIVLARSLGFI